MNVLINLQYIAMADTYLTAHRIWVWLGGLVECKRVREERLGGERPP